MGGVPERTDDEHPILGFAEVLPEIERLWHVEGELNVQLHAGGDWFGEIFSGCSACTLSAIVQGVPAVFPWDTEFGHIYNVCTGGWLWFKLAVSGRLGATHMGTPCRSMTWSREPQLRS